MANIFPSYDTVVNKTATPSAPSVFPAYDAVVKPPAPVLNQTGNNVNTPDHLYNPLNPNNQLNTPQPSQSLFQNFKSSIMPTIKSGLNKVYDIAGGLVAPGITHDELRNPQILKDTLNPFSQTQGPVVALNKIEKQVVRHPLDTAVTAVGSAAKGISNTITNGIINVFVPKALRAGTQAQVQETLDKYLGGPNISNNPTRQGVAQGFEAGGAAAPFIGAGEAGAAVAGFPGMVGGFVAAGQTQVPLEATVKERTSQMMNDLVGLGLFEVGSKLFSKIQTQAYTAIKDSILREKTVPGSDGSKQTTPVKDLTTYPIDPPSRPQIDKVKADIEAGKPIEPIKVIKDSDGKLGVIDGVHRLEAYKELGLKDIPTETLPSKVGRSIETKAIEKGLTEGFDQTAGYDKITVKEQAQLTSDLLKSDIDKAVRMAMGEESIPREIRGGSLLKALEDYAFAKGDVGLIRDLANSPLAAETSVHAQELRMLAERTPDSPVALLRDLKATREARLLKKTGEPIEKLKNGTIKEINSEVKPIPKDAWSSFIESIKC